MYLVFSTTGRDDRPNHPLYKWRNESSEGSRILLQAEQLLRGRSWIWPPGLSGSKDLWHEESAQMPKCRGGLVCGPWFAVCPPSRIFVPNCGLGQVPYPPRPWRPTGFSAFLCADHLTCIPEPKQTQEGWAGESQDLARPSGDTGKGQSSGLGV